MPLITIKYIYNSRYRFIILNLLGGVHNEQDSFTIKKKHPDYVFSSSFFLVHYRWEAYRGVCSSWSMLSPSHPLSESGHSFHQSRWRTRDAQISLAFHDPYSGSDCGDC